MTSSPATPLDQAALQDLIGEDLRRRRLCAQARQRALASPAEAYGPAFWEEVSWHIKEARYYSDLPKGPYLWRRLKRKQAKINRLALHASQRLTDVVQSQQASIEALEKRVRALEARLREATGD